MIRLRVALATVLMLIVTGCTTPFQTHEPPPVPSDPQPDPLVSEGSAPPAPTATPTADTTPSLPQTGPDRREPPVPTLEQRPDLLIVMDEPRNDPLSPWARNVYGYYLSSQQLVPLTGGETRGVQTVTLSPDHEWFAYTWQDGRSHSVSLEGICVQSTKGGQPTCYWGLTTGGMIFRPGSRELYFRQGEEHRWWSVPLGGGAAGTPPSPVPYSWPLSFSPDGRWLVMRQDGLEVVDLTAQPPSPRNVYDGPYWTADWLDANQLIIVAGERNDHRHLLVDVETGSTTVLGMPAGRAVLEGPTPDPTRRFFLVTYGHWLDAGEVYEGDAIFDTQDGSWTVFEHEESTSDFALWSGQDATLLLVDDSGTTQYDPLTGSRSPWISQLGRDLRNLSPDGRWSYGLNEGALGVINHYSGEQFPIDVAGRRIMEVEWLMPETGSPTAP